MRISSKDIFDPGALVRNQSDMMKTQAQIASGRRILSPADDPIGAAEALRLRQAEELSAQYQSNQRSALNTLAQAESVLGDVGTLLQDIRVTVVAAGNGTLSDSDRRSMAQAIAAQLDQLIGYANSSNAAGGYLFGGYSDGVQPFTKGANGVVYNGDQGGRALQVSESRAIEVSTNGLTLFERIQNGDGSSIPATQSVFATLQQLVDLLNGTPAGAALTDGLAGAMANIDNAFDQVLSVRSSMGSRMQEIESLQNVMGARDIATRAALSQIEDLDYAAAISTLSRQQLVLEAAQKSYVGVTRLSLFNLL